MSKKRIFRIFFTSQGKAYEIYARKVHQGDMYGFIEVEDIVFGERSEIVVDPSEEALKNEFNGVKRFHIPFNAVTRIDEVEKEGKGKVFSITGQENGTPTINFPSPTVQPSPAASAKSSP